MMHLSATITIVRLCQLCPTQMAYWGKNDVAISTRAAHWI